MAVYAGSGIQTVQPGAFVVFDTTIVPCEMGLIQHSDGTPIFSVSGWRNSNGTSGCCCCNQNKPTLYSAELDMNVALSEGATVAPITVAIAVDGVSLPISEMDSTPAAAGEYNHVGRKISLPILRNCCQTVAVQNTSAQPIDVKYPIITLTRPDLGCIA